MELGSEFSLNVSDLEYSEKNIINMLGSYNIMMFDSGRNALRALFDAIDDGSGTVLLPEYICESVINVFPEDRIRFYKIKDDFSVDPDDVRKIMDDSVSIFYLMHYFGTIQDKDILNYIKESAEANLFTIIEDTTHSILSSTSTIGDYMVCSYRKWTANPGCGILYSDNSLDKIRKRNFPRSKDNERVNAMIMKEMFLRNIVDCNEQYRNLFAECENRIDENNEIKLSSYVSEFLVGCFNAEEIRKKRSENYYYLLSRLRDTEYKPINRINKNDCPFAYVIRTEKRDELRKLLTDHKIYCAAHWPRDRVQPYNRPASGYNADTLLSLPIDQRYGRKEMDYLADTLIAYSNKNE